MDNSKFLKVLFSTKNNSKILKEFNKLSSIEKQEVLSNDKVKHRVYKVISVELLISMLIDLPFEFRINFLKEINCQDLCKNYEKVIIEFLQIQDYDDFDYQKLVCFENIKEKSILPLIFRKLSTNTLKMIILQNYYQFINDYAFVEYSKKNQSLSLESVVINNINDNILVSELKRRNTRENCIQMIDMRDFIKIEPNKQNFILVNGNIESLQDKFVEISLAKYSDLDVTKKTLAFQLLLKDLNYLKLLELQTILYNLDDENAREMMKLFFKEVCKFECELEDKYLNSMIFNFRRLNAKTKELYKVVKMKPFSIVYYLNTELIDDEVDKTLNKIITIDQYQKTNIKKINKLTCQLDLMLAKEEKPLFINLTILAYKLYYVFGYENAVELLNQKFGFINVEMLSKLLDKCDIKDVSFQKIKLNFEPEINSDFIRFIIGNKKDNNSTIKRILRGELDLLINEFPNLYNNFERFQQVIGNKIHLNKVIPLLEENSFMLLPNEYKMTKDIIDKIIKSYLYNDVFAEENNENNTISMDRKECVIEACNFYHNYLEKRVVSTIPRVYGVTKDSYRYEVLRLDDPIIMTLGYQTKCCFRLNGMSKEFLKYCSESLYARVIVIRNENNEICSMIPIIRNGNVIAGNSIESNSNGNGLKTYNALTAAFNDIIIISAQYEKNPIIAGCVTNLHSNVKPYSNNPIKQKIFPINNSFYTNYGSDTYIVSILPSKSERDFELYIPSTMYFDERPSILDSYSINNDNSRSSEIEKRVKSINYQLNIQEENFLFSRYIICSEDWYLKIDYKGVSGYCLEKDPRAIEEFNAIKNHLEFYLQGKKMYEINMSDLTLNGRGFDSAKSRQLVLRNNTNKI